MHELKLVLLIEPQALVSSQKYARYVPKTSACDWTKMFELTLIYILI